MAIIEVKDLVKTYKIIEKEDGLVGYFKNLIRPKYKELTAVNHINFEIQKGELVGYIGENGARLSGGERQRISIARALLKNAPVVLLDEATASLDVENESEFQKALSRLLQGKTVIVIAHRMRTVLNADKIVVLKEGRVVEQGSPADLLQKEDSLFRYMVELQGASAEWTV